MNTYQCLEYFELPLDNLPEGEWGRQCLLLLALHEASFGSGGLPSIPRELAKEHYERGREAAGWLKPVSWDFYPLIMNILKASFTGFNVRAMRDYRDLIDTRAFREAKLYVSGKGMLCSYCFPPCCDEGE